MVDKSIPTEKDIKRKEDAVRLAKAHVDALKEERVESKKMTEASLELAKAERELLNTKEELTAEEQRNLAELDKKIKKLSQLNDIQKEAAEGLGKFLSKNAELPGKMGWLDKFLTS